MAVNIGINGFGRIGRMAVRAAWDWPELNIVHVNDPGMDPVTAAHLLNFDSVHRKWSHHAEPTENGIKIGDKTITLSGNRDIGATPWGDMGVKVAVESTGLFKTQALLGKYLESGVSKVVVSCPVKDNVLNIVMGVNDSEYDPATHNIITAASCTTNCMAPVVKVIHENLGIKHGSMTTIHSATATQNILDNAKKDLRRARATSLSLIPTTSGAAIAISMIFPDLEGKINGLAIREPLINASLTDMVFEVNQDTDKETVNSLLKTAADSDLKGILGYEDRPLVSVDYTTDPRASIVDGLSTMVINQRQVKVLSWYDNEYGYVNQLMKLVRKVGLSL